MKNPIRFLAFFLALATFQACSKDESTPSLEPPANCTVSRELRYARNNGQIVNTACVTRCHYPGSGIYDYSDYDVLANRIRSGRLEERLLLPADHPLHMPQGFVMDACNLYKLRLWIHQ